MNWSPSGHQELAAARKIRAPHYDGTLMHRPAAAAMVERADQHSQVQVSRGQEAGASPSPPPWADGPD